MKHWMLLSLLTFSVQAFGNSQAVLEETLYYDFQKVILDKSLAQKGMNGFSAFEQGLFVDALWDLTEEKSPEAMKALESLQTFHYGLYEKLRIGILRLKYSNATSLPGELVTELELALRQAKADVRIIYTIAAYETELSASGLSNLVELARSHSEFYHVADDVERKKELTKDIIADIFYRSPDVTTYMNGEYVKSVKLFMFCRSNRLYPCAMIMRNVHGEAVRNPDGSLWTQPALASSARGLPSYVRNGNTPAGVLTIDSVMPSADQQVSFGKFRRLILNFVPRSRNETLLRSLIPESSASEDWWRPTIAARDVGRNLLRIHGTGKINNDSTVPYFPFMRTSGCIAKRENSYNGMDYQDQRDLLDTVMKAMDFEPAFQNEPRIKGILYLVDLDDTDEAVTSDTLRTFGIE